MADHTPTMAPPPSHNGEAAEPHLQRRDWQWAAADYAPVIVFAIVWAAVRSWRSARALKAPK
jgi:hypothetical protein